MTEQTNETQTNETDDCNGARFAVAEATKIGNAVMQAYMHSLSDDSLTLTLSDRGRRELREILAQLQGLSVVIAEGLCRAPADTPPLIINEIVQSSIGLTKATLNYNYDEILEANAASVRLCGAMLNAKHFLDETKPR